jgi:hypothetical protein
MVDWKTVDWIDLKMADWKMADWKMVRRWLIGLIGRWLIARWIDLKMVDWKMVDSKMVDWIDWKVVTMDVCGRPRVEGRDGELLSR